MLTIILNELLEGAAQKWVLVLDDYHVVSNPVVHSLTTTLIENQPPGLGIILAARSQPPLPIPRWRARGQLSEIRAHHLRFSADEVRDWMVEAHYEFDVPLIERLVEKTEGWGAALQLAMSLLAESPADPHPLIENLSGSHPYIFNYLMQEIFERQPRELQEFLLRSSLLNQLNARICRELFGYENAYQMLEALENDNLLLARLDEEWYRYHPLFREFLLNRLARQSPEALPELHAATARYFEAHGEYEAAVQHYLLANQPELAAAMLSHFAPQWLDQERLELLIRYFRQIGRDILAADPQLLLIYGQVERQLGHLNDAVALLEQARAAASEACAVEALIELASIARSQGDYRRADQLAAEAVALSQETTPSARAHALMELAKCEGFLDGMDKGRALAEAAIAEMRRAGSAIPPREQAQLLRSLGQICWWHGDVDQAVIHCQEALRRLPDDQSPLTANILITLAIPILYRHQYDVALDYAERALRIVLRLQLKELLSATYTVLGNILTRVGQLDQAESSLRQAIDLANELGGASYNQVMAAGYLAHNLMAQGRTDEARQVAETALYPHQQQATVYEIYVCRSVLADTYLDAGQWTEAEAIFRDLTALGEIRQYRIPLAMAYFGQAYICLVTGRSDEGTELARRSLALLTPSQTWELYVDQGQRARVVCDALRQRDHPLIRRIYAALDEKQTPQIAVLPTAPIPLRVQTLGSLRVFQGDQEIDPRLWISTKARDLLAYFITFRSESIPLDRIVDALWSSDLNSSKAAFHTAMYRLRHALRTADEQVKFVLLEAGSYRLNSTRFDVDADRFDAYLRQANRTRSTADYRRALDLYAGEYLSHLYYDWLMPERLRLSDQHMQALRSLQKVYAEGGNLENALTLARQALMIEPLAESVHCDVMRYLHRLGDRQGVVKQYALLEQLLRDELGLAPMDETQRLYAQLMKGDTPGLRF